MELRKVRKKCGITQEELAKRLKLNRATVSKYETGQIKPTFEQIQNIAEVLGVALSELLPDSFAAAIISGTEEKYEERLKEKEKAFYEAWDAVDDKFRRSVIEEMRDDVDGFVDSDNGLSIIQSYLDLNEEGQFEAVKRIMELAQIPKYQRTATEERHVDAERIVDIPPKEKLQEQKNNSSDSE